jgi:alkaline phosphatase
MKFAIITDIHLGQEGYWHGVLRRVNSHAKSFLSNFVKEMNENIKPEFVVVLGDHVQDESKEKDKENLEYITNLFSHLEMPVYYAAGNHDLINISESNLSKLLKQYRLYYSFDQDNLHFVVLHSKFVGHRDAVIDEEQLKWLRQDLNNTNHKTVVFVHCGLADQDLTGNPWFEGAPEYALIKNRVTVRRILEESGKVIAVFNSHLHWDRKDVHNSIPYYSIQSLTENEDDKGIASEAYAIVEIEDGSISVDIKGNYPKKL